MIYILKPDNGVLKNLMNDLGNLNSYKEWQVEIKPYKKNRSLQQNKYMWKCLQIIGDELGYTPEELHEAIKFKFLGTETRKTIFGQEYETVRSTTGLTTKEFAEHMDKIQAFAMSQSIVLPQPDYYGLV